MHRAQTLALLLAAGLLCSGCSSGTISSNYRPVEDLTLVQTIGVDRAPEGVCLSASTGRVGENEPPQRMTQTGETVLAALDRLQDRTPNAELFYAQTSYLLLGEEAAAAGELAKHAHEPFAVGDVQAGRRLIQHIERLAGRCA